MGGALTIPLTEGTIQAWPVDSRLPEVVVRGVYLADLAGPRCSCRVRTGPSGGDEVDKGEYRRLAMAYRFHPEIALGHGMAVQVARRIRRTSASATAQHSSTTA